MVATRSRTESSSLTSNAMLAAVVLIPLLYVMRRAIDAYLGKERADQLRHQAAH